ncbi:TetR/AcrR family transcriptional regulator [Neorhizobium sp. NPDC001467]|uniref:TetR/AcrR family transcriptional regulator n=1 Tax=Neorhizobium sp. NPDC001467 TaxID=3390595 RepID=UPI003D0307C5
MRIKKEAAEENKRNILETASKLFKTQGAENVSVGDLMKAAGFTHGGFYNHFESKADLTSQVVRYAFKRALCEIESGLRQGKHSVAERLTSYCTSEHRDDPDGGCPTGSLPVDVARLPKESQKAFADGLERYLVLIQGDTTRLDLSRKDAIATLSMLVGGIILSRAVRNGDPSLSDEILRSVHDNLDL